jgi:hypothetical protein
MIMEGKGWRNKADSEEQNFQLQNQEGLQEKPTSQPEYDA